jgi:hypothetical protein
MLSALALLAGLATPSVAANGWTTFNHNGTFAGASGCGAGNCLALACAPTAGGTVSWQLTVADPGYSAETASVRFEINGRGYGLEMQKAGPSEDGRQTYEAEFDAQAHAPFLALLKAGNRVSFRAADFGGGRISLTGSSAALDAALRLCAGALPDPENANQPVRQKTTFNGPSASAIAVFRRQNCVASESEIFQAITGDGHGVWDANQLIVSWAESGFLTVVSPSPFTYRIEDPSACKPATAPDSGGNG